ncbi:EamA family transporter [Mangrovimonas sp. YM274]|uniref:EamA family transporter n=1 Tax=Mangrovimonas sp. YM274 TaxID=3070660 RepID=UPI0027DBDB6F|nr:EamA family transporter [Mangrovimonas sp. YM274]WMI67622.1 EamA family transporter [Mangrovimonas sp. YM274]
MYLLLSILSSTLIVVIFKLIKKSKADTLQAIVTNYFTACSIGLLTYSNPIDVPDVINSKWFLGAISLGTLFISIFYIMAITTQRNGISVAAVASKMSVVIPVIFGIFAYNESTDIQKVSGIVLALVAVYLASVKNREKLNLTSNLTLPFLLFLGSGIIDTSIKYLETTYVGEQGIPLFSATIFFSAATIGSLILIYKRMKSELCFSFKSVFWGILLGTANFASIYFLLKALNNEFYESSTLFTLNNVGIVMLSTLTGLALFKEHLSYKNWTGIALAIVSILLITLA